MGFPGAFAPPTMAVLPGTGLLPAPGRWRVPVVRGKHRTPWVQMIHGAWAGGGLAGITGLPIGLGPRIDWRKVARLARFPRFTSFPIVLPPVLAIFTPFRLSLTVGAVFIPILLVFPPLRISLGHIQGRSLKPNT